MDVSPALVAFGGLAGESSRRLTATYHGGAFSMQLVGEGLLHPGLVERDPCACSSLLSPLRASDFDTRPPAERLGRAKS